jgi:hypothetical protein
VKLGGVARGRKRQPGCRAPKEILIECGWWKPCLGNELRWVDQLAGNIAGVSQTAILLKAFGRLVRTSLWNYRDQAG